MDENGIKIELAHKIQVCLSNANLQHDIEFP